MIRPEEKNSVPDISDNSYFKLVPNTCALSPLHDQKVALVVKNACILLVKLATFIEQSVSYANS